MNNDIETIVLNKRKTKKKIKWKNLLVAAILCVLLSAGIYFGKDIKIGTQYSYECGSNICVLGVSNNDNLIEEMSIEYFNEVRDKNLQIVDYNFHKFIDIKPKIIYKRNFDNPEDIKAKIKNEMYIVVYALAAKIDDNTYYFATTKEYQNFCDTIREYKSDAHCFYDSSYVNLDKISTKEELNAAIEQYKKTTNSIKK